MTLCGDQPLRNLRRRRLSPEPLSQDIQPGKELFIDYGQEWVDAWNTYVKEWKPPERSHSFTSGVELQSDLSIPLKTSLEQQTEPY